MNLVRPAAVVAACGVFLAVPFAAAPTPRATLTSASVMTLPGSVDSNSPLIWDLEGGQRRLFALTSHSGVPSISDGLGLERLSAAAPITIEPHPGYGVWMEAVVSDGVDTWYGFYHNEWPASRCGREDRAVPRIGAARSRDRGHTWEDLGVVIMARRMSTACDSANKYVIGGVGDLSVMLDQDQHYLYFFYSQYPEEAASQGVAVARLQWADRDQPQDRIELWRDGIWEPDAGRRQIVETLPGQMGRRLEYTYPSATPLIAPALPWHDGDDKVDAFWGPAVHWNTALEQYVMLLNRAKNESYDQEGIYVSFAPRLDDPALWSAPVKILNGGRWYPQVVGTAAGIGTDKIAGATARFFMSGKSEWMINFTR